MSIEVLGAVHVWGPSTHAAKERGEREKGKEEGEHTENEEGETDRRESPR